MQHFSGVVSNHNRHKGVNKEKKKKKAQQTPLESHSYLECFTGAVINIW